MGEYKAMLRLRFREDQNLNLLEVHVKKWWWNWNGSILHIVAHNGGRIEYPAWAIVEAIEGDPCQNPTS